MTVVNIVSVSLVLLIQKGDCLEDRENEIRTEEKKKEQEEEKNT